MRDRKSARTEFENAREEQEDRGQQRDRADERLAVARSGSSVDTMLPAMFVVSEEAAAAIRTLFEQEGESCVACSPASPTASRRGHVPGPSLAERAARGG